MKKIITFALLAAMMLTMLVANVSAAAWDGTTASASLKGEGTAENPYLIESAEDLAFLAKSVDEGTTYAGKYITQTADIDLGNKTWNIIGNDGKQFNGLYDGKGFKITNFKGVASEYDSGLFARVNSTADFQAGIINVTLEGSIDGMTYTNDADSCIGALVGKLAGSSAKPAIVANCVVDVDITIDKELDNTGKIMYVGAIAGYSTYASVINCVNKGDIKLAVAGRHLFVGAMLGQTYYDMVVEGCANLGDINVEVKSSRYALAGAMIGRTNGKAGTAYSLKNNINYGAITAKSVNIAYASGGIAQEFNNATENVTVDACANLGAVHAESTTEAINSYAGGILAYENVGSTTIKNCVASGVVTAVGVNKNMLPGAIVGVSNPGSTQKNSSIKDCVATTNVKGWLGEKSAVENCTDEADAAVVAAAVKTIEDAQKATTSVEINGKAYNFVVETPAPETTTPAPETTTPAPETTTPSNPSTGDVTSVIVLALVAACAGAVLTIKKTK